VAHTIDKEIAREARRLAKWQHERRRLLSKLRIANTEIKQSKRDLKKLIGSVTDAADWRATGAKSKIFGGE
jgi:hypothetical protein